jgi:hypothetical protein
MQGGSSVELSLTSRSAVSTPDHSHQSTTLFHQSSILLPSNVRSGQRTCNLTSWARSSTKRNWCRNPRFYSNPGYINKYLRHAPRHDACPLPARPGPLTAPCASKFVLRAFRGLASFPPCPIFKHKHGHLAFPTFTFQHFTHSRYALTFVCDLSLDTAVLQSPLHLHI